MFRFCSPLLVAAVKPGSIAQPTFPQCWNAPVTLPPICPGSAGELRAVLVSVLKDRPWARFPGSLRPSILPLHPRHPAPGTAPTVQPRCLGRCQRLRHPGPDPPPPALGRGDCCSTPKFPSFPVKPMAHGSPRPAAFSLVPAEPGRRGQAQSILPVALPPPPGPGTETACPGSRARERFPADGERARPEIEGGGGRRDLSSSR